jgi:hypothetical protein
MHRVVKIGPLYRVEGWSDGGWFDKPGWEPCLHYFEGPLAIFPDQNNAIEFAQSLDAKVLPGTVVWESEKSTAPK